MKRIATIQDISCLGKCSLTVALPIISAMGIETAVLPTAVLSTHTAFQNFTFRDLTEDIPKATTHWKTLNLQLGISAEVLVLRSFAAKWRLENSRTAKESAMPLTHTHRRI